MIDWQILPGLTPYKDAILMMEQYVQSMLLNPHQEKIILLEHEDVYTSGTSAIETDLISANNIPVFETGRGGKFTYHGPGQRVIYPMLNLASLGRQKDIRKYIADLERWIIATLQEFNIDAFIAKDRVGIWVLDDGLEKKIGAIGVRVKKWITYHGIAVNISTDLDKFNGIVPCGLKDFGVASMQSLGKNIDFQSFDTVLQKQFCRIW